MHSKDSASVSLVILLASTSVSEYFADFNHLLTTGNHLFPGIQTRLTNCGFN